MPLYPSPDNVTGVIGMWRYAGDIVGWQFGAGLVFCLYVTPMLYLYMRGEQFVDCAMVSGFIASILTSLLYIVGIVTGWHLFAVISATAFATLWGYSHKGG